MKYFLIITVMYWNGVHEANLVDLRRTGQNIVECNDLGDAWVKFYLTHDFKDISLVRYECVKEEK